MKVWKMKYKEYYKEMGKPYCGNKERAGGPILSPENENMDPGTYYILSVINREKIVLDSAKD